MKYGQFVGGSVRADRFLGVMVRTCGIPWARPEARALPRQPRHSRLGRLVALVTLLATPWLASAVSLGEIRLQSYLNEPFRAEIPVTALRPGDLDILEARLADEKAFQRFGLERSSTLLGLKFSLQPGSSADRGKIVVSSPDIVREPFFSFLVELKGQRERLIREYTVLLDPNTGQAPVLAPAPTPAPAPSQPVTPYVEPEVVSAPPAQVTPPAPVVQVPQPEAFQGNAPIVSGEAATVIPRAKPQASQVIYESEPVLSEGEYGPIRAGETLWGVAAAVRPTDRVTMNQVMWALFSYNESKFDGSIDRLNKGAVLTVPPEQAMLDISPAEATALIATARSAPQSATQQLQLEQPAATPAPQAPRATPSPQPAYYEEEFAEEEPALPEEPAIAPPQEELSLVTPEPDLEALPEEAELEALPEEPVADEEAYEELPALPDDDTAAVEDESAAEVEQEFAEEGLPVEQAPEEPAVPVPLSEESIGEGGLLKWLLIGLGVLGLGGIAAFFLNRSRREPEPEFEPEEPAQPVARKVAAASAVAAAASAEDTQEVAEAAEEPDTQQLESPAELAPGADMDSTAQFEAPLEFDTPDEAQREADELAELDLPDAEEIDESEGTLDLGSETVSLELNEDPLSEADFQLAYGLYDEAALLLQRAIEATPERVELYEKLAETHFAASNADEFKAAAEMLKARNPGEDVWQRIAIMGQQLCPDDSLFSGEIEAGGGAVDLDMGFDEPADSGDNSVEFDLGEEEPSAAAESGQDESSAFEADFGDLDLDQAEDSADETLADLDDLGLDDLESELDTAAGDADELAAELDDDEFSLSLDDEPEDATEKLTLEEIDAVAGNLNSDMELTLVDPVEAVDAEPEPDSGDELSLEEEPLGEETDFSIDGGGAEDSLELSELPEETDFEVDFGEEAQTQTKELETAFDLPDTDADAEVTDFDLSEVADLSTSELEEDAGLAAGNTTDFELADDVGAATDFELADDAPTAESSDVDLSEAGAAGDITDFELEDAAGSSDETGFDLGDIGEETDFDLAGDDAAEGTDFDLDGIGNETDFDLGDDSDATALDDLSLADIDDDADLSLDDSSAADISGGDEPGTKLDLATAYVEMGETDMARSLLQEVVQAGDAEQKAKAQELLDQI